MSPDSLCTMFHPLRIARSPVGQTSSRCMVNIKNISAVQRPTPHNFVSSATTTESSGCVSASSRSRTPVWMASAIPLTVLVFAPERPADLRPSTLELTTFFGLTSPSR